MSFCGSCGPSGQALRWAWRAAGLEPVIHAPLTLPLPLPPATQGDLGGVPFFRASVRGKCFNELCLVAKALQR